MKAIFSPGPSYSDPKVRETAGWVHIMDLYRQGLEEMGYDVIVPRVPPELIDRTCTVSTITSYDLVAASQLPLDADLFLGPPGYSLAQMLRLKERCEIRPDGGQVGDPALVTYVWNNSDPWRDSQLADEYQRHHAAYDLSATWRWINHQALELSDHVIACSPWVKKTHVAGLADKISIAFWGVDSQRFHPAAREPDVFRILFAGGDPLRKGLWYLLQALGQAEADLWPYELWIVGCAPIKDPPAHWRQFGMVPHADMPQIYQQCSVLCLPTLEDGIALCVQEALASGLPVITSPETAEVFENLVGGLTVGYRDVDGIAHYLRALRANPEHRRQTAAAARALAETQTWHQTKLDFQEIIRRVRDGGPLPFESAMPWLKGGGW